MSLFAILVVAPQIALASFAAMSPDMRAAIAEQPVAAFEVAAALTIWTVLVCWPLRLIALRLSRHRTVSVSRSHVSVLSQGPFATSQWSAPLAEFTGLAHHVRSSLSGVRNEVVLVHPDRKRSLVLLVDEHISEDQLDRVARSLGLQTLAAKELYRLRRPTAADDVTMELQAAIA